MEGQELRRRPITFTHFASGGSIFFSAYPSSSLVSGEGNKSLFKIRLETFPFGRFSWRPSHGALGSCPLLFTFMSYSNSNHGLDFFPGIFVDLTAEVPLGVELDYFPCLDFTVRTSRHSLVRK